MPPVELPKKIPVEGPADASRRPAIASASRALATANRSASEARRAKRPWPVDFGTSAARRVRCRLASNRAKLVMAAVPSRRPHHNDSTPQPYAVTAPSPVTTMSRETWSARSAPHMRVVRRLETAVDVRGERGDGAEGLATDLVALDAEAELLLQGHDELERIDGIEPEPVTEQGHLVVDGLGREAVQMELFDQELLDPLSCGRVVRHNGSVSGLGGGKA